MDAALASQGLDLLIYDITDVVVDQAVNELTPCSILATAISEQTDEGFFEISQLIDFFLNRL